MADYVPQVSRADVLRIIDRDYPAEDRNAIVNMLDEYGYEPWRGEPHRVHLAILKLGGADTSKLREFLDRAKSDFRDVIAPAEYPRFFEIGFVGVDKLSPKDVRQLKQEDWDEYREWLNAT